MKIIFNLLFIVSFSIPSLNMDQKREISDCINKLPAEKMCEVVQIIQESIPLVSFFFFFFFFFFFYYIRINFFFVKKNY